METSFTKSGRAAGGSERGLEGGLVRLEVQGGQGGGGAVPQLHWVVDDETVAAEGLDRGARRLGADLAGVVDQPGHRRGVVGEWLTVQQARDLAQLQPQFGDPHLRLGQRERYPLEG